MTIRTASTANTKKNAKQILLLERERVSGGDGFLSAAQTLAKARGEVLEIGPKKKAVGMSKKGNIANFRKNKNVLVEEESVGESRRTTPGEEEDERMDTDPVPTPVNVVAEGEGNGVGEGVVRQEVITYHTPAAPPSLLPAKKYCDITGLHAAYTDPKTKLRYKGLEVWGVVRNLGPGGDQAYLSMRNAQTSLK
ncbi:INO80 complex subunit C, partial [Tremellales sp. Uapishka_1]